MNEFLHTLEAAESLLVQAAENLRALDSMQGEETVVREKLQPVVVRYGEVRQALRNRKAGVLAMLVQMAHIARCPKWPSDMLWYEIESPTTIRVYERGYRPEDVERVNRLKGTHSPQQFVEKGQCGFYEFCYWLFHHIKSFVERCPECHQGEIQELRRILDKMTEFSQQQTSFATGT